MATHPKASLSDEDMDISLPALDLLVNGQTVTYAINLACKLNLAGIIAAEAGKSLLVSEIVEKIPGDVNTNYLTRIIRFLCAFGVFRESLEEGVGKYNLTNLSQLIRNDVKGNIITNMTTIADHTCLKAWSVLEKCVRSKDIKTPYTFANGEDSLSDHGFACTTDSDGKWPHEHKHTGSTHHHSDSHSHEHPHDHSQENPHEHPHDHPHEHPHDHSHDHSHDHPHDPSHEHPHDHSHDHSHDHPHDHSHEHPHHHSHHHGDSCGHESVLEAMILLRYYADGFKALEEKKVHIVDLGGHSGATLGLIKQSYPGLQCTSVDLPTTIESVKSKPEGVTLVSGDYFDHGTLPKCDVILMKHIMHMYEDSVKCEKILKNCNHSLPLGGEVIICENVVPKIGDIDVNSISCKRAFIGDINMLLFGVAAKTMDELLAIFEATGFKLTQFVATPDVMTQILVVEKVR